MIFEEGEKKEKYVRFQQMHEAFLFCLVFCFYLFFSCM